MLYIKQFILSSFGSGSLWEENILSTKIQKGGDTINKHFILLIILTMVLLFTSFADYTFSQAQFFKQKQRVEEPKKWILMLTLFTIPGFLLLHSKKKQSKDEWTINT